MHVEFARFAGVLIGLLHAVTPPAAAESTRREQKLRFGVATAFEGDACIAIEGPELAAPTVVTVIDTELLPRVFTFVVDASVQNCPLLKSQGSIGTQYRAHLADGELPSDRLLGIAVVGKFPGHGGRRDFTLDLGTRRAERSGFPLHLERRSLPESLERRSPQEHPPVAGVLVARLRCGADLQEGRLPALRVQSPADVARPEARSLIYESIRSWWRWGP